MQSEKIKNIATIRVDSIEKLKQDLEKVRNDKKNNVLIMSFVDEQMFAKKNNFNEQIIEQIKNFPIPIITLVKNSAKEFIFEIVLASHLCIASDLAVFEIEKLENLKLQVGAKNSDRLDFVVNKINAEKASDLGFINKAVPYKDVEKEAFEMAREIANLAPLAIQNCLKAVNEGLEMDFEDGLKLETELFAKIFATEDMKEGSSAFLEKRKPNFRGK